MRYAFLIVTLCALLVPTGRGWCGCEPQDLEAQFKQIVEMVRPSVVTVIAFSGVSEPGAPATGGLESLQKNVGSGVVLGDGQVLTTTSVVGRSRNISVRTEDGRNHRAVRVGADRRSDLALLVVNDLEATPARIGRAAELETGSWLITVGQQHGGYPSCSFGSFRGMSPSLMPAMPDGLIQMTARVFPGQAGGAVVNLAGEVVGLLIGRASPADVDPAQTRGGGGSIDGLETDLSVAIPIDTAREIAAALAANGTVSPAFLGVTVRIPTPELKKLLNIEQDVGVLIVDVVPSSPAAIATIEAGDIILAFAGQEVRDPTGLARLVNDKQPGDRCLVQLKRGDVRLQRHVTLGTQPEDFLRQSSAND